MKLPYIAGVVAALILSIGAGYFFSGQSEDYTVADTARRTLPIETTQPTQSAQPAQPTEEIPSVPKQSGALNALDLSLGNFSIDDPEEKVRKILGEPLSSKTEDDGTRLKYAALEILLRNGKIAALVSQNSTVSTPRNIHDGSTSQEVFDAYGHDYKSSSFEGTTLYEYKITSKDGTPCWLRFAVRDNDSRVDYISVRFVQ